MVVAMLVDRRHSPVRKISVHFSQALDSRAVAWPGANGTSMKQTAFRFPLMNPFFESLPHFSPDFRMLTRLSYAEYSSSIFVFFVRWSKYVVRCGRALNGRWSKVGSTIGSSIQFDSEGGIVWHAYALDMVRYFSRRDQPIPTRIPTKRSRSAVRFRQL